MNRAARLSTTPLSVAGITVAIGTQAETYPEWDARTRRYKPDWCTVREIESPISEHAPLVPASTVLRSPLARLGIELERHRRERQGDDIDVDAAVEAQIDLRTGWSPVESVYIDTLRSKRDLAVLLLLDISGSASEPSTTGVPVHTHQQRAAAALLTGLHELGDRAALYGFRSQGRAAVHMTRVKRFDDPLDEMAMRRITGLTPSGYTRLGAAVRHGSAILERQGGTARSLLVVLSDGFAYDHGYEPAYGEADTSRALAETRRRGIGTLCLSIGATTEADSLRRIFGFTAYAALPSIDLLPRVVGPLFQAALRSAELQRRVFLRRERTRDRLEVERNRT
jgi:nitric oxide reductase NorD protein